VTPPAASASTARRTAQTAPARPRGRTAPSATAPRRATLRLVPARRRGAGRIRVASERTRLLHLLALGVVALALIAVVVGQALLASGQVRLASLENELTLEQSANRQAQQTVAALETPTRIVTAATVQLHMVRSAGVTELPYVSLSVPLPTPKVIGVPAEPASAATTQP